MAPQHERYFNSENKPEIKVIVEGKQYILTWNNTLIRRFHVGGGEFDHVVVMLDKTSVLPIFLDQDDGESLRETLEENMFPIRFDPELDNDTIDLLVLKERKAFDNLFKPEQGTDT